MPIYSQGNESGRLGLISAKRVRQRFLSGQNVRYNVTTHQINYISLGILYTLYTITTVCI